MIFKTLDKLNKDGEIVGKEVGWSIGGIGNYHNKQKLNDEILQEIANDRNGNLIAQQNKLIKEQGMVAAQAAKEVGVLEGSLHNFMITNEKGEATLEDYNKKQAELNKNADKTGSKLSKLSEGTKAMLGNVGINLLAGFALNAASWGLEKLNDHFKITREKKIEAMEAVVNKYNKAIEDSNSGIKTIQSLEDEFVRLSQGVNDAGQNIGLTSEEYARYNEIVNELVSTTPTLLQGYTAEGNAIVNRNTAIQEGIAMQKEYADIARATFASVSNGDDIFKGSKANAKDTQKDLQNNARKIGEIFDDIGGTYGRFGVGWESSKALDEIAGIDINFKGTEQSLAATVDMYGAIADHSLEILKYSKQRTDITDEEYAKIQGAVAENEALYRELIAFAQPRLDWLNAYVATVDDATGKSLMDQIPTSLKEAYQLGLKEIAYTARDAGDAIGLATNLKTALVDEYTSGSAVNDVDANGKKLVGYQSALKNAKKAQDDFNRSAKNADAIEAYNDTVLNSVESLRALANEYKATLPEMSAVLEAHALEIESYARTNELSIKNAIENWDDLVKEARNIKSSFDEATQGGDYYTGVQSFGEIYDAIFDGTNELGNGSISFWKGAEQILGSAALKEAGYNIDVIKSKLKGVKPLFQGGVEGAALLGEKLLDISDGNGKILNEYGEVIGEATATANGIKWDVPRENVTAIAEKLGISAESLTAMIDSARQFSNVDFYNVDEVKNAIKYAHEKGDNVIKSDSGTYYMGLAELQTQSGLVGKDLNDLIDKLNTIDGFNFKTLDSSLKGKDLVNTFKDLSLLNGKKLNLDKTISKFNEMNISAEDLTEYLLELERNGINLGDMGDAGSVLDYVIGQYDEIERASEKVYTIKVKTDISGQTELYKALDEIEYSDGTKLNGAQKKNIVSSVNTFNQTGDITGLANTLNAFPDDVRTQILLQFTDKDELEVVNQMLNDLDDDETEHKIVLETEEKGSNKELTRSDRLKGLEVTNEEYEKAYNWKKEGAYSKETYKDIVQGKLPSKFGNVDMDKRAIIQWSNELKKTYKEELASWGYDPPEGAIDTVYGGSDAFEIDGKEVEVAYTPILQTEDGGAELLNKQVVNDYIQGIMDKAGEDGKWSLDEILKLDKKGLEVAQYDEAGNVIGTKLVSGLIAGIGEEGDYVAQEIGTLLHFAGDYGAISLAIQADIPSLEELDIEDKEIVISAIIDYINTGDLEKLVEIINTLPPEVSSKVAADIAGASANIDYINGELIDLNNGGAYPVVGITDNTGATLASIWQRLSNLAAQVFSPTVAIDETGGGASKSGTTSKKSRSGRRGSTFTHKYAGTPDRRIQSNIPSMAKGGIRGRIGPHGKGGLTLTGELGTELVWSPSEGISYLVGQYGPEMVNLPKDAVVYPADETRRIVGDTIPHHTMRFGSMAGGTTPYSKSTSGGGSTTKKKGGGSSGGSSKSGYEEAKKKLDHQLKMGYLTEENYYKKLKKLQKKYAKELKKNADKQRAALEDLRGAWVDAYEAAKKDLDHQLEMGQISEATYYTRLKKLGDKYYKNRKGYSKEWKEHLEDRKKASKDAYDAELEDLDRRLDRELISLEEYYIEVNKLQDKYLSGAAMKDDKRDADDDKFDKFKDQIDKEYDAVKQQIDDNDLFNLWVDGGDTAVTMLQAFRDKMAKDGRQYFETEKEWRDFLLELDRDIAEAQNEHYEKRQDQLNNILDLVEEMLRQEAKDYIDALEKQKDSYSDIIKAKRESLKLTERELSYQEDMADYAKRIAKLQNEINVLSRDDSRSAAAKISEKQEELAELLKEQAKAQRDETLERTEDNLDKQDELYGAYIDRMVETVENWLNNKAAVLEVVMDTVEQRETNDLLNRLIAYNGEHGDAMKSTVETAMNDIKTLATEYGDDVESIVEVLQKGINVNVTGGIISTESTDYEKTQQETRDRPIPAHHSGLATGFTGKGYDLKQNEVYRLLTDDELVFNREDQMRIASQLQVLDTIKSSFDGLNRAVNPATTTHNQAVELTINAPINIEGNATGETVRDIKQAITDVSNKSLDRLNEALRMNGVHPRVTSNLRKN